MTLDPNMGTVDRALRAALGGLLVVLALTGTSGACGWIGVVPLLTAGLGHCPAYRRVGLKTCGR